MTRLLPRTLFGQMIVILLGGLLVSHVIGTWIYASDRAAAVRSVGGYAATQRIANLARLIDEAPPDWRSRIVAVAGRHAGRRRRRAGPRLSRGTVAGEPGEKFARCGHGGGTAIA